MAKTSIKDLTLTYDQLVADVTRMLRKDFWPKGGRSKPGSSGWYPETWDTVKRMHLNWPSYYTMNAWLADLNITFSMVVGEISKQLEIPLPPRYRIISNLARLPLNRSKAEEQADQIITHQIKLERHPNNPTIWSSKTLYDTRVHGIGLYTPLDYLGLFGESLELRVAWLQDKPVKVGIPPQSDTETMAEDFVQTMGAQNVSNLNIARWGSPLQYHVTFNTSRTFWDMVKAQKDAGAFSKKWTTQLGYGVVIDAVYNEPVARMSPNEAYSFAYHLVQEFMEASNKTIQIVAPRDEIIIHHDGDLGVLKKLQETVTDFHKTTGWTLMLKGPSAFVLVPEEEDELDDSTANKISVSPLFCFAASFTLDAPSMGFIETVLKNAFGPHVNLVIEQITHGGKVKSI